MLPSGWAEVLLEGLAEHFRAPAPLRVPVRGEESGPRGGSGPEVVSLAINGQAVATLRRTGALERPRLTTSTLSPELDQRLLEAVQRMTPLACCSPFPPM